MVELFANSQDPDQMPASEISALFANNHFWDLQPMMG